MLPKEETVGKFQVTDPVIHFFLIHEKDKICLNRAVSNKMDSASDICSGYSLKVNANSTRTLLNIHIESRKIHSVFY